jgi:hypothetical protein
MLFLLLKTTALQCTENQLFFYTIIMWTSWTGTFFFFGWNFRTKVARMTHILNTFWVFSSWSQPEVPIENHRPAESCLQTLPHNIVSSTLSYERDSNSRLYFWGTDFMIWNFCHQICFDGNNFYTIYWLLMR